MDSIKLGNKSADLRRQFYRIESAIVSIGLVGNRFRKARVSFGIPGSSLAMERRRATSDPRNSGSPFSLILNRYILCNLDHPHNYSATFNPYVTAQRGHLHGTITHPLPFLHLAAFFVLGRLLDPAAYRSNWPNCSRTRRFLLVNRTMIHSIGTQFPSASISSRVIRYHPDQRRQISLNRCSRWRGATTSGVIDNRKQLWRRSYKLS